MTAAVDDAWAAPRVDRFRDLPDEEAPALALSFAATGLEIDPTPARAPHVAPLAPTGPVESALPLFALDVAAEDDEPLVKVPAVPRMPLAVRKTPEVPRLRPTPASDQPRLHEEAALQFVEEPEEESVAPGTRAPKDFVRPGRAVAAGPTRAPSGDGWWPR